MSDLIQLIVGLGNPGQDYDHTRHNAGAWLVEALADEANQSLLPDKKLAGLSLTKDIAGNSCRLLCPTTFMNHSGRSVSAALNYYKLSPSQILVAHDDLDLPAGVCRIKKEGGHGGHNGLRDIIKATGTTHFYRLRIGIGHPGDRTQVLNYVLGCPSIKERNLIQDSIARAINVLPLLLSGHADKAMQALHTNQEEP